MTAKNANGKHFSPYITFTREEWSRLSDGTSLSLSEDEVAQLRAMNEHISLQEVSEIYNPLSRLLHLYVEAAQQLYKATDTFLRSRTDKVPYIIGIAGSVAVGKSTTARILQALLSGCPNHPKVDLVKTDGFLHPNKILEQRGLMRRKGFPESYDIKRLLKFLADVKSGLPEVSSPIYSHLAYDILPDQVQVVRSPDILIVEGLNVLQVASDSSVRYTPQVFVSDFFDFSIYVDADETQITEWYIDRFQLLRNTAFQNPNSYFHRFASFTEIEAAEMASHIWRDINAVNLKDNIAPTRSRAQLILVKGPGHAVERVKLRKL